MVLVREVLEVWVKEVWRRVVVLVGEVFVIWAKRSGMVFSFSTHNAT